MGMSSVFTISKSAQERKAFLDELTLLSLRHGMVVETPLDAAFVQDIPEGWDGYRLTGPHKTLLDIVTVQQETDPDDITGRRLSELSNHELLILRGGD